MINKVRDIVVSEVGGGGFQHRFIDTDVFFGPVFDSEYDAAAWYMEELAVDTEPKITPERATEFTGKQAAREIKQLLAESSDKYPGAAEYILECITKEPLDRFFTKKEKMYAELKGIDLYGWKEVDEYLFHKKRVPAIVFVRESLSIGLKEAKELVDRRLAFLIQTGKIPTLQ